MSDAGLGWLRERLAAHRSNNFMAWRDQEFTYAWLLEHWHAWQERLRQEAIPPRQVVALEGDYSPETIALLLALIENACIIVPLTSSVEAQKPEFMDIAEVQAVIALTAGDAATVRRRPAVVAHPLTRGLIERGEPGLVLFSSGSTGKSKAALHAFAPLLAKFQKSRHRLTTAAFLLLDHIGGINTLFYTLSNLGMLVVLKSRNPQEVCLAIQRHRVELFPTTPTFLNLLLISETHRSHDLSSLKRITYGTEVMPRRVLERLCRDFPGVEFQQTYGLSELGILRSKSRDPDSLWVKVGGEGFETKVVDGILWIRAQSAMLGYLNAPTPFDGDGWFNTQDTVDVDGDYIRILGRQSDIINVGGVKVHPAEVENVLLELPNVRDVVVRGERNPITGQIVVAEVNLTEPEHPDALRKRVREFCRNRMEPYKIPAKIQIVSEEQYSQRFKKMRRPAATAVDAGPAPSPAVQEG